jgi:hypothetical protein
MAKTIVVSRGRAAEVPRQNIPHTLRDAQRYGMWCKVLERHSEDHTVDVETAEGFTITRIPVSSREWVTLDDPVLGERNLPPVSSIVFMFMPTGGIDNAFIFGSCFLPSLDKHTAEFLQKEKENEELTKSEGNWKRTFDKVTGDLEIVGTDDDDKTLTLTIKKSEKKIHITDWNENDLVVDENGIILTDTKGNTAAWDDSGIKTEDKNGNKSTLDSNGIIAEDKNGNVAVMDSSGMKVEDKTGNALTMGSGGIKLEAKTILELIGQIIKAGGTAIPNGQGGWCAITMCPYAGIPHVGDTLAGG